MVLIVRALPLKREQPEARRCGRPAPAPGMVRRVHSGRRAGGQHQPGNLLRIGSFRRVHGRCQANAQREGPDRAPTAGHLRASPPRRRVRRVAVRGTRARKPGSLAPAGMPLDPWSSLWWATLSRRGRALNPADIETKRARAGSPSHAKLRRGAATRVHTGSWRRIWLCNLTVARPGSTPSSLSSVRMHAWYWISARCG
jgi:hypothetical protein